MKKTVNDLRADLGNDTTVFVKKNYRSNSGSVHIDERCRYVNGSSQQKTAIMLFDDREICKYCLGILPESKLSRICDECGSIMTEDMICRTCKVVQ